MIVDRTIVPDVMKIPGSSGKLYMVDHTLIDVPFANVYLDRNDDDDQGDDMPTWI